MEFIIIIIIIISATQETCNPGFSDLEASAPPIPASQYNIFVLSNDLLQGQTNEADVTNRGISYNNNGTQRFTLLIIFNSIFFLIKGRQPDIKCLLLMRVTLGAGGYIILFYGSHPFQLIDLGFLAFQQLF